MSQSSSDKSRGADKPSEDNRRGTERVPAQFSVVYSGMSNGRMLIGNGIVSNVSKSGIGILGDHLVTHGMDLSLFINLPGIEEPMCVAMHHASLRLASGYYSALVLENSYVTWQDPSNLRQCPNATPAAPRTWGALKAQYR